MALTANEVIAKCTKLVTFWNQRNVRFRDWYSQLRMVDTLKQRDMESFVGNDPRAAFNLLFGILNQTIPHRLPAIAISSEQVAAAAELSSNFDIMWENVHLDYRQRGRKYQNDLIKFLLITGWYSIFASISLDGSTCISEVWNPVTVYPMWTSRLSECAHVFTPGEASLQAMAQRNGWQIKSALGRSSILYDYWYVEELLGFSNIVRIHNAIVVNSELVKVDTVELRFKRIPIFISPVGGLPDTGELTTSRKSAEIWKGEMGQSFLATNENIHTTTNRWWTFIMQLLRDVTQPRTFERSNSANQIVKPETWYRRGAHYKLGLQDEVGFITPPPIPVELRGAQLDLEAMQQRGGPSGAAMGNIPSKASAFVMSQVSALTNQMAKPYRDGVVDGISDIDNFWLDLIKTMDYKPYGLSLPKGLPDVRITADYELRIPGDIVNRATTARILNPSFELSDERIMEEIFPEIKNPIEEIAGVRAGKARKHPVFIQLTLLDTLRQEAELLRKAGDIDGALIYEKAYDRLEMELMGTQQATTAGVGQTGREQKVSVRPEVVPPTGRRPVIGGV